MKKYLYTIFLLLIFGGCAEVEKAYEDTKATVLNLEPIYNVINKPIVTLTPIDKLTIEDIEKAIIRAGASENWVFKRIRKGKLEGSLYRDDRLAEIIIVFNKNRYSIFYKDSSNLRFDNEYKMIYEDYNTWIKNLQQAINAKLGAL